MTSTSGYATISHLNGKMFPKYKDARVVRHCVKLHYNLKSPNRTALAEDSKKFRECSTKMLVRQSCIPLCNFESSSGTSSRINSKENREYTAVNPLRHSCVPLCSFESSSGTSSHGNFIWKRCTSQKTSDQQACRQLITKQDDTEGRYNNNAYFSMQNYPTRAKLNGSPPVSKMHYVNDNLLLNGFNSANTSLESTDRNSTYESSEGTILGTKSLASEEINPTTRMLSRNNSHKKDVIITIPASRITRCRKKKRPTKIRKLERATLSNNPRLISDNLCIAVVATLCCWSPLGIVALYYTWKVQRSLSENNIDEARLFSLKGRKFAKTGVKMGIIVLAFVVIFFVVNVPYSPEYECYLPDYNGG